MAEALGLAAAVVGIAVPALHGARLLLKDLERIVDAPSTIKLLQSDLSTLVSNIESLKSIQKQEWQLLGQTFADSTQAAVESCDKACETFRSDLLRWTRRSRDGKLSWRDRAKVGFFKEHQIRAVNEQLQSCKMTFTSVLAAATLYSSIRNTQITAQLLQAASAHEAATTADAQAVGTQIAVVENSLARLNIEGESQSQKAAGDQKEDEEEDFAGAESQLQEELTSLRLSQALLLELAKRMQKDEVQKLASTGAKHSTNITFGTNQGGMQTGINHGAISWNTPGKG